MNLDAMEQKALRKFWLKHRWGNKKSQDELGVNGNAVCTLAAYAMAKNCAIELRRKGEIERAQVYERHCEIYYSELPEEARW